MPQEMACQCLTLRLSETLRTLKLLAKGTESLARATHEVLQPAATVFISQACPSRRNLSNFSNLCTSTIPYNTLHGVRTERVRCQGVAARGVCRASAGPLRPPAGAGSASGKRRAAHQGKGYPADFVCARFATGSSDAHNCRAATFITMPVTAGQAFLHVPTHKDHHTHRHDDHR